MRLDFRIAAALVLSISSSLVAAPRFNLVPLGFTDEEHSSDDGYQLSQAFELNGAGQVRGYSARFGGNTLTSLGWSSWFFDGTNTIEIGPAGPEYTRADGFRISQPTNLNEAGQVSGYATRFRGSSAFGSSAWLYNGTSTIELGLKDGEHSRNDGYQSSDGRNLNEAGQVWGFSTRFDGGATSKGQSVWLYDGVSTFNVGLRGIEHTRSDGYKYSNSEVNRPNRLNEAGQVIGYAERFHGGSTYLGHSAWLYNGTSTIDVGLAGAEHTRSDGFKDSFPDYLNQAGQVSGYSNRYQANGYLGRSAWYYDGSATFDIGLTDSEHTHVTGGRLSRPRALNETGQVIGSSARYNGSASMGASAWLYDGAQTIDIGLTGDEHTRNDGLKSSSAFQLNEAGHALGTAMRYDGGSAGLGQSAWLYNGTTTLHIGLIGPNHRSNTGYKYSEGVALNEAGQVIGYSYRFGESISLGQSAWLFDGATTTDIGPTGGQYTSSEGFESSFASQLNDAGQAIGSSTNFSNTSGSQPRQDAWFYDPVLRQTIPLVLSTRSDGYAYSQAEHLGDDGLVLGTYALFDALDNDLGKRAFYFTVDDGLHDLGSIVEGGLTATGWDYLASAWRANGARHILGQGKLSAQSGGDMPFLLTPAVPEPTTCLLCILAIGYCPSRWQRRSDVSGRSAIRRARLLNSVSPG